jgi:hypothetical protein
MLKAAKFIRGAAIVAIALMMAARADAASVSGVYTSRGGAPLADHQLHFENRVSGDMFLARTGSDGSFSSDLPPGVYDLRAERGLVVKSGIRVEGADFAVGRVTDGAPLDVRRPFEREGVAPSLLEPDAPATAHVVKGAAATNPSIAPSPPQATASTAAPH